MLNALVAVQKSIGWFSSKGVELDVKHPKQVSNCVEEIEELIKSQGDRIVGASVLDVGSRAGALGPILALSYNVRVTEVEANDNYRNQRKLVNGVLKLAGRPEIILKANVSEIKETFDAVFIHSFENHIDVEEWLRRGEIILKKESL